MIGYQVEIKGLQEQLEKLGRLNAIADRHLTEAMRAAVLTVEAAAKQRAPVGVSGMLRASIGSEVRREGLGDIVGRVGSSLEKAVYPIVMEFGARPHWPYSASLELWVQRKLRVKPEDVPRVTYLVAQKIARAGIEGRQYLKGGFEASERQVLDYFTRALERIANDLAVTHGG